MAGSGAVRLEWPGRADAAARADLPPGLSLQPAAGEGLEEQTTRHVLVTGDNLDVLRALRSSHAGQARLVYIDPPYNTGSDFIYRDRFAERGAPGADGHAPWLSFLLPRLLLARELLGADGFLVVSIDDAELPRLRLLLDDVLGEHNFLATLVWDRNRKNDARYFSVGHEYMLVYARDARTLARAGVRLRAPKPGVEEVRALFERLRAAHGEDWASIRAGLRAHYARIPAGDPRRPLARYNLVDARGPYERGNLSWHGSGGPRYPVEHPVTGQPVKVPSRGWMYPTRARFDEALAEGRIDFGPDEHTTPRAKVHLFANDRQVLRSVRYSYAQTASQQLDALFGGRRVFDHPKPLEDLAELVAYLTGPEDLVVDFFAGSGSTGHAVWLANAREGSRRRFLLVQESAPVNPRAVSGRNALALGMPTLDAVTRERLLRASAALRASGAEGDLGFRLLRATPLDTGARQGPDAPGGTGTGHDEAFGRGP